MNDLKYEPMRIQLANNRYKHDNYVRTMREIEYDSHQKSNCLSNMLQFIPSWAYILSPKMLVKHYIKVVYNKIDQMKAYFLGCITTPLL